MFNGGKTNYNKIIVFGHQKYETLKYNWGIYILYTAFLRKRSKYFDRKNIWLMCEILIKSCQELFLSINEI